MNFRTFLILFLLGISCSCTLTYEKNFGDEPEQKETKRNLFEPRASIK